MLVASIVLLFTALALGLLVLLERYETADNKTRAAERANASEKVTFYDPFPSRRPAPSKSDGVRLAG